MSVKLVIMKLLFYNTLIRGFAAASDEDASAAFAFNGLGSANLSLSGMAELNPNGLLKLTNNTRNQKGQAFHPKPFNFKNSSTNNNGSVLSFSTSFVVAIVPEYPALGGGHGLAFVIAPTRGLPGGSSGLYLGVLNDTSNGNFTNHVVAVELDTIDSREFQDINGNHVGIDINQMESAVAKPAGYYANDDDASSFQNLSLVSGHPMQVWVEYDGLVKIINVTLAPVDADKPKIPLLSLEYDLSPIINQAMYIGFSSSTGSIPASHYVLGWSFKINGLAPRLYISQLPSLPSIEHNKKVSKLLSIGLPVSVATTLCVAAIVVVYQIRKRKFAEVLEDWEQEYGPQRIKYKELYIGTKGFRESELLGTGGFGRVYRGTLQYRSRRMEIAVKRVLSDQVSSSLGIKSFIAEIVSMGRLRHRNLVPLLGYCRRKTELLLVYEYMQNGSLDKFLFGQPADSSTMMSWRHRLHVIKGVASGLLYLHEEWEQVVVHRDIKSSNVLLDKEYNGKIGDFGLAKLYDHGTDPHTTRVMGTRGYIAPENLRTARATTSSDVYSFGAFLLEVACGRRPIDPKASLEELPLVDWVALCWRNGEILLAVDPKLGNDYATEEVGMVLKLGLLCCAADPRCRPSMRQVALYLEGTVSPPDLSSLANFCDGEGFDDHVCSCSYSNACPYHSYISNSILSGGR